jgi:hypothetical protein
VLRLRVRRLSVRYLDVEVPVSQEIYARVVERPGRWMTPDDLAGIVDDLRAVAAKTLDGASLDYGVLTGSAERLEQAILTLLYHRDTGEPVAFNALTVMRLTVRGIEQDVLHMGLVMVDPTFRSRRLSWVLYGLSVMLTFFHQQLRPLWISSVTQVPAVYGMVAESFDQVFPAGRRDGRRAHTHLVIARQIMDGHRHVFGVGDEAGFDPERFVITNAYTGGSDNLKKSFESAPKHRNDDYNRLCEEQLDYERGDDFLQIGLFNLGTARRYLMRSVPRRSLGWLLYRGLFLLGGSVLLPVLHWFTPSVQFGDLRPWKG